MEEAESIKHRGYGIDIILEPIRDFGLYDEQMSPSLSGAAKS
jgi:hypothetical protein